MKYTVTPFTLGRAVLESDPLATLARAGRHIVQTATSYDERTSVETEAEDRHGACETAWQIFQNIDEDWQTPDRKRSLMIGDLARVTDEDGATTWWIACSIGWVETVAPGDVRVEVSRPASAETQ